MVPADTQLSDGARGTPQLAHGVNIRALPIGPEEAFVLSRIDGVSTESEIAAATNFSAEDVARILTRLAELGAIVFESEQVSARMARSVHAGPPSTRSGAYRIGPITETQGERISHHPAAVEAEPERARVEPVELEPEVQRQLLAFERRMDSATHYELLGIEPRVDAKAVRTAYYELVRVFHPDRYFGKNLGTFKAILAKVFARLTEAYEALHRAETRAEYDKYLLARQRTFEFEHALLDPRRQAAEVASAMQRIERAARAESLVPEAAATASSKATSSLPPESARHSIAPQSDADRRRALARKLGHSSAPPARASFSPPKAASEYAADELKRRYEARLQRARIEQLNHYVRLSEEAASRKDLAAAANALRIACSLDPENPELAERLAELENRASAELWEAYAERAKYAAFEGRHAEAAESFERAALGRPSAIHFERAAFHLLEAGGDLKRASSLAKNAVALAPQSAKCRVTLAQVYLAAKLRESALAELERARALEPDQPLIKDWIERAKRGD